MEIDQNFMNLVAELHHINLENTLNRHCLKYFLFDCRKNILISLSMPQKSNFISIKTKIFSLSLRVSVS